MSHLAFTLLLAIVIAASLALLGSRSVRERVYYAVYVFLSCMTVTVAGGWIMRLIHG